MKTGHVTSRAVRIIAVSFALTLVGCGANSATLGPSSPTATPSATSSPTATPSPQESASPTAAPTSQPTPQPLPVFSCADASGGGTASEVVAVRVGQHDGYDRLVIEFNGPIPAYSVKGRSGTSFTTSPRGQTVTLGGTNGVLIVMHSIVNWTSYSGPYAFEPNFPILREARQIENFEGYQQWALGIQGTPCIRVTTLTSPSRLVVDVAATP